MTTYQPSLYDAQVQNINRVRGRIGPAVLDFCRKHVGQLFHLRALEEFVNARVPGAPDSPSRILRDLRQAGYLDYEVVNRRQSLYRVLSASVTETIGS